MEWILIREMTKEFVVLAMIFCHIFDDYVLQGILAQLKQRSWWEENAPEEMYKMDYYAALAMHGMSWAFMVMLPVAIYYGFNVGFGFVMCFVANAILHASVDDMKANMKKINLLVDQGLHMLQIILIAGCLL